MEGGFKFQVQRVNEGAGAPRLPGAWRSRDISLGGCSADERWRSIQVGCSPTGPCPWASTGAETVRVFINAALPGAIRIGKEDLDSEPHGQALVLGHLFAPIIRQGFAQQCGDVPEFFS
jgi:hypothetical protein